MTKEEINSMTRDEVIDIMIEKANNLKENGWTRDGENEIWNICNDWNSEHYDGMYDEAEIFMCECDHDEYGNSTETVCGFYIEDDYWVFADR